MRLRARTHSSPCTPTATPTHPPVCSPSPPAPHEHTKADCGLSQGQVHKTERHLDFCSDLWVIRKAGSQPESACSAWAPTQPADVGTRRRGLAAGESQRHLPGLRPSLPHPRRLAPANSKGFSSLTDSSPKAPASLCSHPHWCPWGTLPPLPLILLPLGRECLCLAHSYVAIKTQHLCYLFQEAALACSMRPARLPLLCTSSTLHEGLEGLASVSVLGAPGGVGCVPMTSASPQPPRAWPTGAQRVSWTLGC